MFRKGIPHRNTSRRATARGQGVPYRCSANCSGEGPLSGTLARVNGSRVGYARCSTDEQDVIVQTEQLLALGMPEERIYIDRGFSGTTRRNRAGLDQALAAGWTGTVFTVTKFDRFARNMEILTGLSGRRPVRPGRQHLRLERPVRAAVPADPRHRRRVRGQFGAPAHSRRHGAGEEERQTSVPTAVPGFLNPGLRRSRRNDLSIVRPEPPSSSCLSVLRHGDRGASSARTTPVATTPGHRARLSGRTSPL